MKFVPFSPKFNKLLLLIHVDNILKSALWKKWSLRDLFVQKKWRAFLNDTTDFRRCHPFENEEFILVTESRFGGSSRLVRLISGGETKVKTRNGKVNTLEHNIIIGRTDGDDDIVMKGVTYRLKRPSLEDYTLHMKRVATPSYPKDIQAMLSMAQIRQGSCVLEAGTGSGALTLFLSRAVGKEGYVHSFDNNTKHMKKAKENIVNWISSWNKTKHPLWPQNMTFYNASLKTCMEVLPALNEVDAILLDLQSPENFLEFLLPVVKQESPIVIFLPSITQVVDVVSYCNTNNLPFHVDNVIEVTHRMWKIQPVMPVNTDIEDNLRCLENQSTCTDGEVKASVKYAAKPSFQQLPHSGFILKLLHRRSKLESSKVQLLE